MIAAVYARVSTNDQNCEMQLRECREYLTARGFTIAAEYIDKGVSGTKASRPELNRMMADAKRCRFNCLVTWSLDRLGRSVRNLSDLISDLDNAGVRYIALKQGVDTNAANSASRLLLNVLAACAEFEHGLICERTAAGIRRARAEGKQLGRPRNIFDRQRLMDLRAAGLSWRKIAAETGIPEASCRKACAEIVCASAMLSAQSKPVELVN